MTHEIDVKRRDDQSPAHVPGVCVTRRSLMNMIALPLIAVSPSVGTDVPDAELIGFIDQLLALKPKYYQFEWRHAEARGARFLLGAEPTVEAQLAHAEAQYNSAFEMISELERKVFATRARTLAGVKAKAYWYLDFYCCGDLEQIDGGDESVISLFKELTSITDGEPPRAEITSDNVLCHAQNPDPIFAAIAAHRSAHSSYVKAVAAADNCVPDAVARIQVGMRDDADVSVDMIEGGGKTITWKPNGKKMPVYASCSDEIVGSVPKDLPDADRDTWIAERHAELGAEERRIAAQRAKTPIGKLEDALEDAHGVERDRMWDLIWTAPTTAGGLAALLAYCREMETINEIVQDDVWEDALEWSMECAACALACLPKPPMTETVASLWDGGQEVNTSDERVTTAA
jgi:hypothetical protein